jgi:hypothetical protein
LKHPFGRSTPATTGVGRVLLGSLFALMLAAVLAVTVARAVAS